MRRTEGEGPGRVQPLRYDATRDPLGRQDGRADATMNTLRVLINMVLGILLPVLVQRWDRDRFSRRPKEGAGALGRLFHRLREATIIRDEHRSGLWNFASWGAAVYALGPISMLGWIWVAHHDWARWRERGLWGALARSVGLLALGVVAMLLVSTLLFGIDQLVAWALGLPD